MLSTTETTIGICLFELPDKDQAVIQRVITFGASQGKHYSLQQNVVSAQIIVTLDNTALPSSRAVTIRIGEAGRLPADLLLQRPLLVTRVMRSIDDAAQIVRSRPIPEVALETNGTTAETTPQEEEQQTTVVTEQSAKESEAAIEAGITEKLAATNEQKSGNNQQENLADASTQPENEHVTTEDPVVTQNEAPASAEIPHVKAEEAATQQMEAPTVSATVDEIEDDEYNYLALVVDDSAAIRKQLEIELRNAQIKADFAETGEEALEKSAQKQYDIIFLDIIMPGIDGYEVCRQMRARKSMKKTPIIMLSGKTSPLDEVQGVIAGASTYLTKPVKHEQFQQTLKRVSKWLTEFSR
ncbi:MAG: response regulator [Gammaproteobacteria bacterium]|nr:response regulator [Gammaproteobacteria bacterium]MBU1725851.1 response regulator [Gammaproteobacteria bacterium]MBU2005151.1 response regulator [Gammaproteobacteria bacterium]